MKLVPINIYQGQLHNIAAAVVEKEGPSKEVHLLCKTHHGMIQQIKTRKPGGIKPKP
jgi:hypothetical protein